MCILFTFTYKAWEKTKTRRWVQTAVSSQCFPSVHTGPAALNLATEAKAALSWDQHPLPQPPAWTVPRCCGAQEKHTHSFLSDE